MQLMSFCLWFDSQAEEAAQFYKNLFGGKIKTVAHYSKTEPNHSGLPLGSVLTVEFEIANAKVLGLNGGPMFKFTPSLSFFVSCDSTEEIERYWKALNDGGQLRMGLDKYPWAERYGWTADRYGVEWQLMLSPRPHKIAPTILFVDKLFGRGQEALDFYTSVFPNSKIEMVAKDPSNTNILHASFTLDGNPFVLTEGAGKHGHQPNEAFSLCLNCDTQKEIDHYWEKLIEGGGAHSRCGWLKDRFGVSWQVNPALMSRIAGDPVKFDKAMNVVMKQSKIILADIEAALSGVTASV